jgi:hypothetical protein
MSFDDDSRAKHFADDRPDPPPRPRWIVITDFAGRELRRIEIPPAPESDATDGQPEQ